jgi:hypothetical protein
MCHAEYYKNYWAKEVSSPRTFGTFCMSSYDTMISGLCEVRAMLQECISIDGALKN